MGKSALEKLERGVAVAFFLPVGYPTHLAIEHVKKSRAVKKERNIQAAMEVLF